MTPSAFTLAPFSSNSSTMAEVNAEGGRFGNPLQAALFNGNEAIVKLLLENGAEVNASECKGREIWKCTSSSIIQWQ